MDMLTARSGRGKLLPGAVPVPCHAGDVIVHARNVIHGSLPNTSPEMIRGTLYLGFFPAEACRALNYDADVIRDRQAIIPRVYVPARYSTEGGSGGKYAQEQPFLYTGLSNQDQEAAIANGADLLDSEKYPV